MKDVSRRALRRIAFINYWEQKVCCRQGYEAGESQMSLMILKLLYLLNVWQRHWSGTKTLFVDTKECRERSGVQRILEQRYCPFGLAAACSACQVPCRGSEVTEAFATIRGSEQF